MKPTKTGANGDCFWKVIRHSEMYADKALMAEVRDRDGDTCRYCTRPVSWRHRLATIGATYDHVDPNQGNSLENLVIACKSCNSRKGQRTPEQAGMVLVPPGFTVPDESDEDE